MVHPADLDIGRSYSDPPDLPLRIEMRPANPLPWSLAPTMFKLVSDAGAIERLVYHPHLAMLRALKDYRPVTVLDIGCGDGNEAELFRFAGADITTINADPAPSYRPTFFGDYLDFTADHKFDLVWCSHVLEHTRNPGLFLDKIFDDLNEDGVLVLSVPYNEFNYPGYSFTMGHHNRYNVSLLIYQLICAGFDCRTSSLIVYNGQISIILTKVKNRMVRATMAPWNNIEKYSPVKFNTDVHSVNWDTFYIKGPNIPISNTLWKSIMT